MFTTIVIQRIFIGIGVIVTLGILVHDTKFDQAIALTVPVAVATFGLSAHAMDHGADSSHTHVERASLQHAFAGIPRIQARDDHRKYNASKYFGRNNYFGGTGIIWPST